MSIFAIVGLLCVDTRCEPWRPPPLPPTPQVVSRPNKARRLIPTGFARFSPTYRGIFAVSCVRPYSRSRDTRQAYPGFACSDVAYTYDDRVFCRFHQRLPRLLAVEKASRCTPGRRQLVVLIMRPAKRGNASHASIPDAIRFPLKCQLLQQPVVFGLQPQSTVETIDGPAAGVDCRVLGQRDHVQDGRAYMTVPILGKSDCGRLLHDFMVMVSLRASPS